MASRNSKKILLAFDFDHTIIDENSDLYVRKLAPNEHIPENISALFSNKGWTEYMGAIFKYLHSNGTTPSEIEACMHEIPLTDGMRELFDFLSKEHIEVIIISDSNSQFIKMILENFQIEHSVTEVFTNPANFDTAGCLQIEYHHFQDWCQLSTKNLCKGHILQQYRKKREQEGCQFASVFYVGDGSNDFCPTLRLSEQDYVLPRKGFQLLKKIRNYQPENNGKDAQVKAKVFDWDTGRDILKHLREVLENI
ncbi:hypothetical protein ScPMuIL_015330 [Solemya velum]